MTTSSEKRIKKFVDCFIRTEFVQNWTSEKDNDFFNEPDRASRVWDAAENGADGKTHAEVIGDWREAFTAWMCDKRRGMWSDCERFSAAVEAHFDTVEAWHEKNGSLHQQIG